MSALLINQMRRASAAGSNQASSMGALFAGRLLSTGAFIFVDDGVTKILPPSQNSGNLYGLSGDPKIMPDGKLLRSYAYGWDTQGFTMTFYDGIFDKSIGQPVTELGSGPYSLEGGSRAYRHRSDDNKVVAATSNIAWAAENNPGRIPIDFRNNVTEVSTTEVFRLSVAHFDKQDAFDTIDHAKDTYFGNVIGLGSGILVTASRASDPDLPLCYWHDGDGLYQVPAPSGAWMSAAGGKGLINAVDYQVRPRSFHPLFRNGVDTALCTYEVDNTDSGFLGYNIGNAWTQYMLAYDYDNFPSNNFHGRHLANSLIPPIGNPISNAGPIVYGGFFQGQTYGLTTIGPDGFLNPIPTGQSGDHQNWGIYFGSYRPDGRPNFDAPDESDAWLIKIKGGPYMIWFGASLPADFSSDPITGGYESYGIINHDGNVINRDAIYVSQGLPLDPELPGLSGSYNGYSGIKPAAGCLTDSGAFILGYIAGNRADLRCGPINRISRIPAGGNQAMRPVGGGQYVFMNGMHSADLGLTWANDPEDGIGGVSSNSAGAMSVPYTFRLTPAERAAAVNI